MATLSLESASLTLGTTPILVNASLTLNPATRIGLIGRNGSGKSSLLKTIAGLIQLDQGKIHRPPTTQLNYVLQEPQFSPTDTVFSAIASGLENLQRTTAHYHDVVSLVKNGDLSQLNTLADLQQKLDNLNGWQLSNRVEMTISQLKLEGNLKIATLSGGIKKRVALAQALVSAPDILLLDEPTNHLDIQAIEWLESWLSKFKGSLLFISHDRSFINNVATQIIELDRGKLTPFPSDFDQYQKQKALLLGQERQQNRKFDQFLRQEQLWSRQGVRARGVRNQGRLQRFKDLQRTRDARQEPLAQVNFAINSEQRSGEKIVALTNVHYAYGEQIIVEDFTTQIMRGEKVALIGPNGIGKSTLIKLIVGELSPARGHIELGTQLNISYFDQFRSNLDEEATVIEAVSAGRDFIEIAGVKKHIIHYLEDFLFTAHQSKSPIKVLSGGERNRVLLARLFAQPTNLLILDEPTNDLDIETIVLLEKLLASYQGTLFLISHDRTFIDQIVTHTIAFEQKGKLYKNVGGYQDWLQAKSRFIDKPQPHKIKPILNLDKEAKGQSKAQSRLKLSFNEKRELKSLPEEIALLEQERDILTAQLLNPHCFRDNPTEALLWKKRIIELDNLINKKFERWEILEIKQHNTEHTAS